MMTSLEKSCILITCMMEVPKARATKFCRRSRKQVAAGAGAGAGASASASAGGTYQWFHLVGAHVILFCCYDEEGVDWGCVLLGLPKL